MPISEFSGRPGNPDKKRLYLKRTTPVLAFLSFFAFLPGTLGAAETLKRRVLVLPFENVLKNKNYAWMSDSISENVKTELLKSGRFEILDVTLLRKIDPQIQFANLDAGNASAFALRLNCEVAIVGRYTVKKQGTQELVNFEADAVDALEKKSVVVKNQDATVNAEIFDTVGKLAVSISDELILKLAPLDAGDFKRDDKLERLIYRLEHPPKGFLDSLSLIGAPETGSARLEPKFDIDTYDYDVYVSYDQADGVDGYVLDYQYWGKRLNPGISVSNGSCTAAKCTFTSRNPTITLTRTSSETDMAYKLRIHLPDPRGPLVTRWWVSAGYPSTTSLGVLGHSNAAALARDGKMAFDDMRGMAHIEAGIGSERWQLGHGLKWALVTQFFYANGTLPEFSDDSGYTVKLQMLSAGGGLRLDRPVWFAGRYGLSPFVGIYAHYQTFFREAGFGSLSTAAFAPELGLNQYYRFGFKQRWRWLLTLAVGSFIYSGQNLSYARANLGVEYAFK